MVLAFEVKFQPLGSSPVPAAAIGATVRTVSPRPSTRSSYHTVRTRQHIVAIFSTVA